MGQQFTKTLRLYKESELSQKVFADQEYFEIIENTDLRDKIKKIIWDHGPFTDHQIDIFVEDNLHNPVVEEIFNEFKGNEDIRNAMKRYGATTIYPIMPHLIYMEFFHVNENLVEQKEH